MPDAPEARSTKWPVPSQKLTAPGGHFPARSSQHQVSNILRALRTAASLPLINHVCICRQAVARARSVIGGGGSSYRRTNLTGAPHDVGMAGRRVLTGDKHVVHRACAASPAHSLVATLSMLMTNCTCPQPHNYRT